MKIKSFALGHSGLNGVDGSQFFLGVIWGRGAWRAIALMVELVKKNCLHHTKQRSYSFTLKLKSNKIVILGVYIF